MILITDVQADWILDSRGLPTVKCYVTLSQDGVLQTSSASVPSGASTGSYEALELRDGGEDFAGKGVNGAIDNIYNLIANKLIGREFKTAKEVDEFILTLDSSKNKSEIGANAILAVSMATHRAFAELFNLELWQYLRRLYFSHLPAVVKYPRIMANIINGGVHGDNQLAIQEFMILPKTGDLQEDIQLISETYQSLKKLLHEKKLSTLLGDEGGFSPNINSSNEAFEIILEALQKAGYSQINCSLAIDAAANEFFNESTQKYHVDEEQFSSSALVEYYQELLEKYPVESMEDILHEDDFVGWSVATQTLGKKVNLVGDDLFVTNSQRFQEIGLDQEIANSILIKLNQVGSVLETANVINLAKENNYTIAVSHRSGETTDDFISDLAIACQSDYIKIGAPARGERVAKYNRLLEIQRKSE